MLSSNTIYAAIPVTDMDKARDFYGKMLGLHIIDENENGVWYQTGGSRVALYRSEFAGSNKATCAIWEVLDPEGTIDALKTRGIVFEHYNLPGMKRKGDIHISGSYKAAWFKDPFGNIICIAHHL